MTDEYCLRNAYDPGDNTWISLDRCNIDRHRASLLLLVDDTAMVIVQIVIVSGDASHKVEEEKFFHRLDEAEKWITAYNAKNVPSVSAWYKFARLA